LVAHANRIHAVLKFSWGVQSCIS